MLGILLRREEGSEDLPKEVVHYFWHPKQLVMSPHCYWERLLL